MDQNRTEEQGDIMVKKSVVNKMTMGTRWVLPAKEAGMNKFFTRGYVIGQNLLPKIDINRSYFISYFIMTYVGIFSKKIYMID